MGGDPSLSEPIGFDRLIELDWLDLAASRYASTGDVERAIADTTELVAMTTAGGGASRFAVAKNMTIVGRVWLKVPERVVPLRDAAAHALMELGPVDRMAVHWSMCQLAYPFYLAASEIAGRSFAAQGIVTVAALRSRLSERWGAVAVVPVAARKVLGTWIRWGVVREVARASYEPTIAGSVTPLATRFVAEARVLADQAGIAGSRRPPAWRRSVPVRPPRPPRCPARVPPRGGTTRGGKEMGRSRYRLTMVGSTLVGD